jgi:hypothetical protein
MKEEYRAKAEIKYGINLLEARLNKCFELYSDSNECPEEIYILCQSLFQKYLDYASSGGNNEYDIEPTALEKRVDWKNLRPLIVHLKKQIPLATSADEEQQILIAIAVQYALIDKPSPNYEAPADRDALLKDIKELLIKTEPGEVFNPNRIIDAVMLLQQRLIQKRNNNDGDLALFHHEMINLYKQLSTADCRDLYAYFTQKDCITFLESLFALIQVGHIDWLPGPHEANITTLSSVFQAIQQVMDALRGELKNRHIHTVPYDFVESAAHIPVEIRAREIIERILAVYGHHSLPVKENIEDLFSLLS